MMQDIKIVYIMNDRSIDLITTRRINDIVRGENLLTN